MKDRAIEAWIQRLSGEGRSAQVRSAAQCVTLLGLLAACGGLVSACSLSVPMSGLGSDDIATGTIKPKAASPLSAEMDPEDWRRAKSALDTALDPQGNGASVTWDNPASGAKGSFLPLSQPYPKDDGICRPFKAQINLKGKTERVVRSSACRVNSGDWVIGHVASAADDTELRSDKGGNLADRGKSTQLN